jgi:Copper amine oxidase, enzyme domain
LIANVVAVLNKERAMARIPAKTETSIEVSIKPFGPTTEELLGIGVRIAASSSLKAFAGASKLRLLYVECLNESDPSKAAKPLPPSRFRATFYDDRSQRAIFAEGSLAEPRRIAISESGLPPPPSEAEFEQAVKFLMRDAALGRSLAAGHLQAYQPIPALVLKALPDGRTERHIAVGLLPRTENVEHEIVGVDLRNAQVTRFDSRTPSHSEPHPRGLCGAPASAGQQTAGKGTAGQVWITVKQGSQTLWRFLAVRPAASSGTNGSAIELKYVDYKGKRVLYRAHVPILNVKYDADKCGPYRDWQNQEGMIQAQGSDVAPGFRLCATPAQTIMDTGSDAGNFLGVAIYVVGSEVVLVSEMQAGWYRYVSQWRLAADGTIRPRFGFAAVESQCVCNVHHHHVYWRLDFDLRTAANNHVREFNDPPLFGSSNWHDKLFEIRRPRDYGRKRRWRVENTLTKEAYDIVPGAEDGVAATHPDAPFGRGDLWVLRYHGAEIDDGSVATGPPYEADIDKWVNGEAVGSHDIVVWYGAHFTHDVAHDGPAQHGHIVGPDLRLVKW